MPPPNQSESPFRSGTWENGATVGRYILLSPIAQGGMAEIWLARQSGMKGFEKVVVVKRMINALEADPDSVEMFLTEARLAAQLNHPNVIQVYELGEFQSSYYMAMEYLDGENLASLRRTAREKARPLPDALAARIVAWAAEGLHYAHTKLGLDGRPLHIVHRDVSPQNLIVTYDGGLKVVDFGIAKVGIEATLSGMLKGKPAYMSPQQARGQPADARADVFALGVVLFELLTGSRLIQRKGNDLETLGYMSGHEPFPRVRERRPDVPRALDDIVAHAMERDCGARYQSARELQFELEDWIRTAGEPASSAQVSEYMRAQFADRISERRALIEAAMSADFSPSSTQTLKRLAEKMAGNGSASLDASMSLVPVSSRSRWIPLAIAGSLAVGVPLAWWTSRPPPPELFAAVQPAPAVVPQPAPEVNRASAILAVSSDPVGAEVTIDGLAVGVAPVVLDTLSMGYHVVEGSLAGRERVTRPVTLERSVGKTEVLLTLAPLAVAMPPTVTAPRAHASVAPRALAPGKLTLKTEPWTTVHLGKQNLGDTPLINVTLPAGRHVLQLTNPESNIQSSIEVEIKPNETTVKKMHL